MANGDVTVKILYRQSLGGGRDANGVAKSNKILVLGEIVGTWVDSGLAINKLGGPAAFGVDNLDFIKFEPTVLNDVYPTAEKLFIANYNVSSQKIFCLDDMGEADPQAPDAGENVILRFVAVGDDANAPEL
jgi:hypothetical protein